MEAESRRDVAATAALRSEIGHLEDALAGTYGLAGGSGRSRDPRSPSERARKSVTNRLRAALARLDRTHAEAVHHLAVSLRTGTLCTYRPERDPGWDVVP